MRIGTWNMDGGWSRAHQEVLEQLDCDVLLLTEPHVDVELAGYRAHATQRHMGSRKHWAAVMSKELLEPIDDPHPASAAALINDIFVCASVLPWPRAGEHWPWGPPEHQVRMELTLDDLIASMPNSDIIWGGDWNQPLTGNLAGFSRAAQASILSVIDRLSLQVPTSSHLSRREPQCSIDHIAVSRSWIVRAAGPIAVEPSLSDHDAYWVEVIPLDRH